MSGIDGCYYCEDEGFQHYPGAIFSKPYGPRGGKRKLEPIEREYWQEVSFYLQELGLGAYQSRQEIYKLEERMSGANSKEIELIYHWEPISLARKLMYGLH